MKTIIHVNAHKIRSRDPQPLTVKTYRDNRPAATAELRWPSDVADRVLWVLSEFHPVDGSGVCGCGGQGSAGFAAHVAEIVAEVLAVDEPVARVVYRPDRPLSCGARVWIETELEVSVS